MFARMWSCLCFTSESLQLVGGDIEPSIGFLVGQEDPKKEIKKRLENDVNDYKPILDIIAKKCLDSPLYYPCYMLNPYYYYNM